MSWTVMGIQVEIDDRAVTARAALEEAERAAACGAFHAWGCWIYEALTQHATIAALLPQLAAAIERECPR